jgi:hypothetical protein
VPGDSLQRTYEGLVASRAGRVREHHPKLAPLILALSREPRGTRMIRAAARAEMRAAAEIMANTGPDAAFLFNRSLTRTGRAGDIDVLVVGPAGVFVIDVQRTRSAPAQSGLGCVESLLSQAAAVREILAARGAAEVPVHIVCCLSGARVIAGADPTPDGMHIVDPRGAAALVRQPGSIGEENRAMLWIWLTQGLPAA